MRLIIHNLLATTILFFVYWVPNFAQSLPKTMRRLPDTGQTQSFTNSPGEDSDFEQNPPFFLTNGDGTVTDTVTGLMWQKNDGGEMTIESAETYCQNLTLGGYSDWRLPTAQEAFSILNHSKQNPPLDPAVFPNSGAEYWWTSERQVGNPSKVWVTNAGGGIGNHPKGETLSAGGAKKFHVRAVRDVNPPPLILVQFTILDSSIFDHLTGLEWQRFAYPDSMTWENALAFAENLVLGGYDDWRLPNIKELESINDETYSQPSINLNYFQNIGSEKFWSGTSLPNQPVQAWFMDTGFGVVSHELKTTKNQVLCVRGPWEETTRVTSVFESGFWVYPNPFSSKIWLTSPSPIGFDKQPTLAFFQLFDGYGRVICFGEKIFETDLSNLPAGIYFLKNSINNGAAVRLLKI